MLELLSVGPVPADTLLVAKAAIPKGIQRYDDLSGIITAA
jgi:hypothetical protein